VLDIIYSLVSQGLSEDEDTTLVD